MTNSTPVIRLSPTPNVSMTPAQALSSALADAEKGMQDVLIVAYDEDGCLYIRSSKMTSGRIARTSASASAPS